MCRILTWFFRCTQLLTWKIREEMQCLWNRYDSTDWTLHDFNGYSLCFADTNPQELFLIFRVAKDILTLWLPSSKPVLLVTCLHSNRNKPALCQQLLLLLLFLWPGNPALLALEKKTQNTFKSSYYLVEIQVPTAQENIQKCSLISLNFHITSRWKKFLVRANFHPFPQLLDQDTQKCGLVF